MRGATAAHLILKLMIKNMTCGELLKACTENKYLLLRSRYGFLFGVNCKIATIGRMKIKKSEYKNETAFIGYRVATLNEYINQKMPFTFNPIE